MSDDVPQLDRRDLEEELRPWFQARRAHHMFAVFGSGAEQTVGLDGAGDVQVIPVRSELELRARLPPIGLDDPHLVFLVPWTHDVPLDLRGRFARDGRVLRIGREARLRRMFGVVEVDPDAVRSPLAEWLLRPGQSHEFATGESRLTADAMWTAWLRAECGIDVDGGLALDALMGWAALDGRGPSLRERLPPPLREALLAFLGQRLGPTGPVVWTAWEEQRGRAIIEYALLFEALTDTEHAGIRMWTKQRVRADLRVTRDADIPQIVAVLGQTAAAALRFVERRSPPTARSVLRGADERVDDEEVRGALAGSTRLPSSWTIRLAALGDVLARAALDPVVDALTTARAALQRVEGHTLGGDPEHEPIVRRAWMAIRLLAWLVARPDRALDPGQAPHGPVETLGRWYAEEGGYVDWARRWARGAADSRFDRGVQAVVHAADVARTELDRRFAAALVEWNNAAQPSDRVVPIHHAIERVAARYLDDHPDRRLLVLLLDGMAWAQTVEILQSLSHRAVPWGPLKWHATKKGRIGDGAYPVVLASLPSITEVSRAAFFGSKAIAPGKSEDPQKDRDRWRDNRHAVKFCAANDAPILLLRSESHTRAGAASQEALSLVGDTTRRLVAIVVNAIDDALKGNPATRHEWTPETIASLPDLLDKARLSGRAVLLASDHGHVPADRLEPRGPAGDGGARWRVLRTANETLGEFEAAFPAGRAWAPRGAHGIAAMADDGARWGSSTHAGEHGGATLAEVVAPCVLVASEDLLRASDDVASEIRPPHVPMWWHLDVQVRVDAPREPVAKPKKAADERQLGLPIAAPVETMPTQVAAPRAPSAFAQSNVLNDVVTDAAFRKELVRAVEFLLAQNGVATDAAFAAEMNVVARRVGGLVAKLQEALNLDGYDVLRYDADSRHVHLDAGKLRLLFEVPT